MRILTSTLAIAAAASFVVSRVTRDPVHVTATPPQPTMNVDLGGVLQYLNVYSESPTQSAGLVSQLTLGIAVALAAFALGLALGALHRWAQS